MHRFVLRSVTSCLLLAAISAIALCAASVAQAAERAFQANLSGSAEDRALRVSGQATHLGQCVGSFETLLAPRDFFAALDNFSESTRTRAAFLAAADGSKLEGRIRYGSYDPETLTALATLAITGGTGRFEDASGTIDVVFTFSDATLADFDCSMDGTLDY